MEMGLGEVDVESSVIAAMWLETLLVVNRTNRSTRAGNIPYPSALFPILILLSTLLLLLVVLSRLDLHC